MSRSLLRLLHAGDFQLHRPLSGFAEASDELHEVLMEAPLAAACGVFDAAIANAVDFVVLSGGVVRADHASPRALRMLVEQFHRLAEKNIAVYWAGGPYDGPGQWPAAIALPDNVHHFAADKAEAVTHIRDGKPLAVVAGKSHSQPRVRAADFRPSRDGLFTVAAAHGEASPEELGSRAIHYWALGGREQSQTLAAEPHVIHYPGAPQGFSPAASGKHGATLVHVEEGGAVRLQAISTDVVRWHHEQVSAPNATSDEEIFQLLAERVRQLAGAAPEKHLMVRWSLLVGDGLRRALGREGMAQELTRRMRKEFGSRKPALWTCRLAAQPREEVPAELYEEETILGDFLRSLRELRHGTGKRLDLDSQWSGELAGSDAVRAIRAADDGTRKGLLRSAAALGVDMLGGAALVEAGAAQITFGGEKAKTMTLQHDGESWKTQQAIAAMLDEEPAS